MPKPSRAVGVHDLADTFFLAALAFCRSSHPRPTTKTLNDKFQRLTSWVLNWAPFSMMKSWTILFHPAWSMNHLFVHTVLIRALRLLPGYLTDSRGPRASAEVALLTLNHHPQAQGQGCSDRAMSKQSLEMLPFGKKVYKFFSWDKRERNVGVVEIDSMISVVAAVKKERRIYAIVIVTSQATSVAATHRVWQTSAGVTTENTLNLCACVFQ